MASARRGLLLFTNVYPYGKGEEFLENELPALVEQFDRVIVLATQVSPGTPQTRELPQGVTAHRIGLPRPTGAHALPTMALGAAALARTGGRGLSRHPGRAAVDALFEGRAARSLADLRPLLPSLGLAELDELTIYSYWVHIPARVAMLAADLIGRAHPGLRIRALVSRAHRYDFDEDDAPLGHIPMRRETLARFDAVHPVSERGTDWLRQRYPDHAAKISTRRLGTPDPGKPVEPGNTPLHVVSCSYVVPLKRLDRFAPILARVQQAGHPVRWTHYGPGEGLDELRSAAQALLGAESVEMPGYVPNHELAERYRGARPTVLVNLSSVEGLPVSIMEAAALGLPVLATDVGGTREIVRQDHNGWLVPADFTDDQVVEALLHLARADASALARWGANARQVWADEFDAGTVYPAFAAELAGR